MNGVTLVCEKQRLENSINFRVFVIERKEKYGSALAISFANGIIWFYVSGNPKIVKSYRENPGRKQSKK